MTLSACSPGVVRHTDARGLRPRRHPQELRRVVQGRIHAALKTPRRYGRRSTGS
ncbi:hypothetical protein [Paludisphaera mucosa]|uniref:Transposase n=1 Tax=Paludisphaera mucosa TaxID=3030827 RepID=A0ABT6FLE4_9BACT|nr:hypothetical protein [Paludisphaera mucosa]MDG3008349.1 hypothetical protein [Paludisphaera mucosa]